MPVEAGVAGPGDLRGPVSVFVLERHDVARRGLCSALAESSMAVVVGESDSLRQALWRVPLLRPDVAVLGATLRDGNGVEGCLVLRGAAPLTRSLILDDSPSPGACTEAVLAGAAGYLAKDASVVDLVRAVLRAAGGERLFDMADGPGPAPAGPLVRGRTPGGSLTPGEQEVLELVGQGLTNRQIAAQMDITEKTVKNRMTSVLAKLGLRDRTQAAVHVVRHGTGTAPR